MLMHYNTFVAYMSSFAAHFCMHLGIVYKLLWNYLLPELQMSTKADRFLQKKTKV